MADKTFSPSVPLIAPGIVAGRLGISSNGVTSACRTLGIEYTRSGTGRRLLSLRDAQKIATHFNSRTRE